MTNTSPDFPLNSSTDSAVTALVLGVSPSAIAKISAERVKRSQPDLLFRVTVSGGGCSGLQYKFGYNDQPLNDEDQTFPADAPMAVTDDMSLRFLAGAVLDYEKDMMGARFAIKNPNAISGCGCGVSFAVDFNKIKL
jgi:iron-sulfur cluster insertion protein